MFKRLRYGEKFAALSALALLGFEFLDWFGADGPEGAALHVGGSGWHTLGWAALALCVLTILLGLVLPFVFATHESPVLPVLFAMLAMVVGGIAVIALIVQVIWQPGPDALVEVKAGWWLGLLAAFGVARGGFLSMRDEYMPGVPLTDVPVRPAPAA